MKIFVTRLIPEAGLDIMRKEAEVDIWPGPQDAGPKKKEVIKGIKQAEICCRCRSYFLKDLNFDCR